MAIKRSSIVKAVGSAFKVLGDIPVTTILRRTSSTYDTATGVNAVSTSDNTISRAIFTKFESFEVDKVVVLATDIKLIFQQNEISITPNLATDTVIHNSRTYNILRVGEDPAAVTYSLQLRAV